MRIVDREFMKKIGNMSLPKIIKHNNELRLNNIKKYNESPKRCKTCNIILEYDKRRNNFCSRSCSASYNNLGVRHNKRKYNTETCLQCGRILNYPQLYSYCRDCRLNNEFKRKASLRLQMSRATIRRYLIRTRSYQCEECNLKTWRDKPIPLDAHHIDGDYLNNIDSNLKLLCKNCHSQTDNYGSKNKGMGSAKRRMHYKRLKTKES